MRTAIPLLLCALAFADDPAATRAVGPKRESRAMVAVDARLHALLVDELAAYVKAAEGRRKFPIGVLPVEGLDDLPPPDVRKRIAAWRGEYPELEGVLLVGNVKLPSFFMPRVDTPSTRYWPRYYEDLDLVAERRIEAGTVLKAPTQEGEWPCVVGVDEFKVPEHDFDWMEQGPSEGPEVWVSLLPVGHADGSKDTYAGWAEQIRPFLVKALAFYKTPGAFQRTLYLVSNDLNDVLNAAPVWKALGPRAIDYYAVNTKGKGAWRDNPKGYVRAPIERYKSCDDFLAYARKLEWMDEGWQSPEVFLKHMKASKRRVVWWNVHSWMDGSLISSDQARGMEGGGVVALVTGCSVGGWVQPGAKSHVDCGTPVEKNILASLIYGPSLFVAATGCPHNRVDDDCYAPLLEDLFADGYLGRAPLLQLREQDRQSPSPHALRGRQEVLIGDPFVDANR